MNAKNKRSRSVKIIFALIAIIMIIIAIYYLVDSKNKNSKETFHHIGKNNFEKLIDVGGFRLHVHCTGIGEPTVILDSGMGSPGETWFLVQREVEKFTRVCSYDRAGYGLSDLGPNPRTSVTIAKELHTLLQNSNIRNQYIVVGHSFGGMNMRTFAALYPHEVVGMVLVDASHEDQGELLKWPTPTIKEKALNFIKDHINYLGYISFKEYIQTTKKPLLFTGQEWQSLVNLSATYNGFLACKGENAAIAISDSELKQLDSNIAVPLVVITAGKDDDLPNGVELTEDEIAENKTIWLELQRQLTLISTNSTHIIAHNSTHAIQLYEPEIIIEAIKNMVIQLRNRKNQ